MRLKLVDRGGGKTLKPIENITKQWQRRLIPLSEFSLTNLTDLRELQIVFDGGTRIGEIYIDDISFVKPWIALPIIQKPESIITKTKLFIFNDNTNGDIKVTISDPNTNNVVTSCTVPNNQTPFCGEFLPGTYKVEALATCGVGSIVKTFPPGPQTIRVFCQQ